MHNIDYQSEIATYDQQIALGSTLNCLVNYCHILGTITVRELKLGKLLLLHVPMKNSNRVISLFVYDQLKNFSLF